MAKLPKWIEVKLARGEVEVTSRGFVEKNTGELLSSRKMTDEQIAEIMGESKPVETKTEEKVETVKEETKAPSKKSKKAQKKAEPVVTETTVEDSISEDSNE